MKITVTATLNKEQIDILAKQKGYQDTITATSEDTESTETIQVNNPQSKEDFIAQVYTGIVANDIASEVIRDDNNKEQSVKTEKENKIREKILLSVTSEIQ